jgi:eukaryotic-like serine/threonine-protein kinase
VRDPQSLAVRVRHPPRVAAYTGTVEVGAVIGERFLLESRAGAGGMATVYRARDRLTGDLVALKVLERRDELNAERFEREARVLAELAHPALVRYIAHGTHADVRYLVMEWLEGCDLAVRLKRGALGVAASLTLARRIAEALAAAHARGIIHRDVKPSNVFLVEERIARAKVVDFGLARPAGRGSLTRTGMSVGTPRFMAPEQVRGRRELDARVDVYGLGAVLYGCLAGQPAFAGYDEMAILAKVLLEDPPPLGELAPEVPRAVSVLVEEMLAKDRVDRPADAGAVIERLDAIAHDAGLDAGPPPVGAARIAVTVGEQRLLSVVLVDTTRPPEPADDDDDVTSSTRTEHAGLPPELAELIARHGDRCARLPDGTLAVIVTGTGSATDQSAKAARLALSIRAHLPGHTIALATGRGQVGRRGFSGDVIDRAAALMRAARSRDRRTTVVDDVTAGLFGDRFTVRHEPDAIELVREREAAPARTLLGRITPCVGREAELAMLEAVWRRCVDDHHAAALLVTGDAGVGKSRLRYELVRRLRAREDFQLLIGRGDPMRAGAAFGLLAPAIRRTAGVLDGEPLEARRAKLRERVGRHLTGDDAARVAEFLGELVGVPFSDAASVRLRTARNDPRLMNAQMRQAWEDWIGAEAAAGPLLLVLEDLHWGDWPTVKFIDALLMAHAERPILVLALARPDVRTQLPGLWDGRAITEIALGTLPRRAGERLVREVLGEGAEPPLVARLVGQAAGNALYLEELIRAVAEGKGDALPASVLAMMQARLDRLPPEARRVLRAASVFSNLFWADGVAALVGGDVDVAAWVEHLIAQEVVSRRNDRKFPDQDELVFRHALVREAAYSLLTEADRALGHKNAAAWLEQVGETDALVLAEHLELGGELERAAIRYADAAAQALEASDLAVATERAARGLAGLDAAGASEVHPARGALHLVTAQAHAWTGQHRQQEAAAQRAMACLARGEPAWCRAAAAAAHAYGHLGWQEELASIGEALLEVGIAGVAHRDYVLAAAGAEAHLLFGGHHALGERIYQALAPLADVFLDDPAVEAAILRVRAGRALIRGDLAEELVLNQASVGAYERAGDLPSAVRQRSNVASVMIGIGAYGDARAILTEAAAACERLGLSSLTPLCRLNLGLTIGYLGDDATARVVLLEAIEGLRAIDDRRVEAEAHADLSLVLRRSGDLEAATAEADLAVAMAADIPTARAYALGHRARIALDRGRPADALADARAAIEIVDEGAGLDRTDGEALVRLSYAQALDATGDHEAARRAIARARARVEEIAGRIHDPAWRTSFVERVVDNARIVALDRAWNP